MLKTFTRMCHRHDVLPLMRTHGKYHHLSVEFFDDEVAIESVKELHVSCTVKHVITTKKSRYLKYYDLWKDTHIKTVFLKRMRLMTKNKNTLCIIAVPWITDNQVIQFGNFSCCTSSKNQKDSANAADDQLLQGY